MEQSKQKTETPKPKRAWPGRNDDQKLARRERDKANKTMKEEAEEQQREKWKLDKRKQRAKKAEANKMTGIENQA